MKLILALALCMLTSLTFASKIDLVALKAEKARIAKLELQKFQDKQKQSALERLLGFGSVQKNSLNKNDCDDIDINIDIDIDDDNDVDVVSPYCEARWSDGTCRTYGSDVVGEVDTYCEARWSDGTCRTYGSDQQGTCYPNCEARWSDGTCRTWGNDICI